MSGSKTSEPSVNLLPFASMAGGWLGPLVLFWLYVWGPLRPFDYPAEHVAPSGATLLLILLVCFTPWWLPASYYRPRPIEESGRLYEALGIRYFRLVVPDGDLANRWHWRRDPAHRIIRDRQDAEEFERRTRVSEKGHLVLLAMGVASAGFALHIGWVGWAVYLGVGNVLVNLYPVLLQRYTRSRLYHAARRWQRQTSAPQ